MKICFLAPSGFGKSTAIEILKKKYNIINIKIGDPLYELQETFYKKIGINCENKQDGELLQFLGMKIRKEKPNYLLETFINKLNKSALSSSSAAKNLKLSYVSSPSFKYLS